jgi:hypothetical protein
MQLTLTAKESNRLEQCESVIEKGLRTFVEVGNALFEIRESKLYRQGYDTFEDYCRDRWEIARNYANKLIAAAEVASNLGTIVPSPTHESQVRPLASLEPEQQREAWATATAENPKPTAAHVQKAVATVNQRRTQPRVSQAELDRIEEEQIEKQRRQVTTRLFMQAVSLFDPRVMSVQELTDHLFEYIDPKETTEVLTKARLERALEAFANIVKQWKH